MYGKRFGPRSHRIDDRHIRGLVKVTSTLGIQGRILLCCQGGYSTNLLMQKMKQIVKKSEKLNEADFDFNAISVDALELEIDKWDVVLLGPQVGHKIDGVKKLCDEHHKPFQVIDKDTYGAVDGATVLKMAILLYKKAN